APDTFLAAAQDLGAAADRTVVLEDAVSGVRAGAAGGFGLVIGVDRGAGPETLAAAGADTVVSDLAELVPGAGDPA
ncbi:MAG: haloacid dehalogenase, partial [Nocardioides sp.]|nr:haloacid dehalogenase [Nocardioides sp.]